MALCHNLYCHVAAEYHGGMNILLQKNSDKMEKYIVKNTVLERKGL